MSDIKVLASDVAIARIKVTDLEAGIYESSHIPKGTYRTAWIMKLRHVPSKCKLPRGFGRLSSMHM
jgi:hypothetical protein